MNDPNFKITLVDTHGCRDYNDIITLPDNIWVVNPCEDSSIHDSTNNKLSTMYICPFYIISLD